MPRRQRNYAAEYAARKQRAVTKGYSISEARGHANVERGDVPLSIRRALEKGRPSRLFREMDINDRDAIARRLRQLTDKPLHEIWSNLLGSP